MRCLILKTVIVIAVALVVPEIVQAAPYFYTTVGANVLRFGATASHTAAPAPGRSGASFATNLRAVSEDLLIGPDVSGDGVPDLYVAESNANQAGRYLGDNGTASTGTRFDSMPQNLDAAIQLRGLAYYQNAVYLTRRGGTASSAITRYDFATDVEAPFASNPTAGLNDPYDVLVDGGGNVYAADGAGHDIRKFSSAGALLAVYDLNGTEKTYMTLSPNGQDIYYGVRQDAPGIRRLHLVDGTVSTVITSAALGSVEPRGITFGPDLNSDGSPDLFVALNTTTGGGVGKIVRLNVNLTTGAGTLIGDYLTNANLAGSPLGLFYDPGVVPEPVTIALLSACGLLMRRRPVRGSPQVANPATLQDRDFPNMQHRHAERYSAKHLGMEVNVLSNPRSFASTLRMTVLFLRRGCARVREGLGMTVFQNPRLPSRGSVVVLNESTELLPIENDTMLKNQNGRLIAAMLLSIGLPALASAAAPYVDSYHVNRQLYVSPTGSGNGLTALTPMSLNQATSTAQPGDLYWLGGGTYNTGAKTYTRNGTKANPIIYRSMPGQRATIVGQVIDQGAYNWFWGLEITDPNGTAKDSVPGSPSGSLAAFAPGAHFINNHIHDTWQNAIGGWNTGGNHVYYGNITHNIGLSDDPIHHGYPIYTQNDYSATGPKYIVQNMFLDNVDPNGNDLDFHAYTEGNEISGLDVRKNIMSNSRFLLGGYSVADHTNVSSNHFYKLSVQFGWRRPVTGAFTDNYLGKSPFLATYYWGINLANPKYPKEGPFNITGNTFVNTPATAMDLTTVSYDATTLYTGVSKLDSADTVDNNIYQGTFTGRLFANNQNKTNLTFAQWKAAALAAGNPFDANSQQIGAPTGPKVIVDLNEYDPTLASMAIYNWAHTTSVLADLSSIMPVGSPFGIYDAKDAYGAPLVSGNYFGPVSVPMNTNPLSSNEFGAYLIRFTAIPEPSSLALLVLLPLALRRVKRVMEDAKIRVGEGRNFSGLHEKTTKIY